MAKLNFALKGLELDLFRQSCLRKKGMKASKKNQKLRRVIECEFERYVGFVG